MKNIFISLFLFISFSVYSQVIKYGDKQVSHLYTSPTDSAAWLSQLRLYEPKITGSLTSRFWRGDKTWQDFNAATLAATLAGFSLNNSAITSSDNIVSAFGKAQQQINFRELNIATGLNTQYWRGDKTWQDFDATVRLTEITGFNPVNSVILPSNNMVQAFSNAQGQLYAKEPIISSGTTAQYWRGDKSWATLDKTAVGLGNVLNVAQEPAISAGATGQYWRGDKTWQTLDKTAVGLSNVLNIVQEPAISAGTTGQYWRGDKTWQTLDKTAVGLGNVDNTSDWDKPVSLATQQAISAATSIMSGTITNIQAGFTIDNYTLKRSGNVVNLNMQFSTTTNCSATSTYWLGDIPAYFLPTNIVYGASSITYVTDVETGTVEINPSGHIYVRCGKCNKSYVANLTWIDLIP
jgi:hypothetical protein